MGLDFFMFTKCNVVVAKACSEKLDFQSNAVWSPK